MGDMNYWSLHYEDLQNSGMTGVIPVKKVLIQAKDEAAAKKLAADYVYGQRGGKTLYLAPYGA